MAKSAPQVSFTVASIDFGTIDVGGSCGASAYLVYGHGKSNADASFARAINMSISFKGSYQASEAKSEGWVFVSTLSDAYEQIGSISDPSGIANEVYLGSVVHGSTAALRSSGHVQTYVSIPAGATAAGHVGFYLHHRYQYTG
jgi:hypothetical protein